MEILIKLGRFLFAIAIAVFGLQYLLYGRFVGGLLPVPPWAPGGAVGAYLTAIALIAAGVSIATKWQARLSATLLAILFLLCVLFLHGQRASTILHDGVARPSAFEPLARCGAAFVWPEPGPPSLPDFPHGIPRRANSSNLAASFLPFPWWSSACNISCMPVSSPR